MALRFSSKGIVCTTAASTVVAHTLGSTPDEWSVTARGAADPFVSTIGSTSATIGVTSTAAVVDFFAAVNHSMIR